MMHPHSVDPEYLRAQYSDNERLRIRMETHQRFSERADDFVEWVLHHAGVQHGHLLLDVGCGDGAYHSPLRQRGVRVTGIDRSPGMLRAAARSLGYTPTEPPGAHFSLDHLPLVQEVFPGARRHIRHDAFVFPDAAPALRYYASGRIDGIHERPRDGSHRPALLAAVQSQVADVIAREGNFRVPKDAGCIVADV